jgi:hypothetical protein
MPETHTCIGCGATVDNLEVFPGPRCLTCWTPIGEAEAQTMTAEKLASMWGGPVRRTRRTR